MCSGSRPVLAGDWVYMLRARADVQPMSPDEYCRQKAAASGSSFYYSFLFLPPERRRAIIALYAFCREVDDVGGRGLRPSVARSKLAWWKQEIERGLRGAAAAPGRQGAGAGGARVRADRKSASSEIVEGMGMDLEYNRYPDFATLEVYCLPRGRRGR